MLELKKLQIFVSSLSNEQIKKEYRKTIPFTNASKKKKNLGINLAKKSERPL
jgi:hypothetical protein